MKIILWVLQVLLAAWTITGAQYMSRHYEELMHPWAIEMFPWYFWATMASLEIIFALGLIIPGVFKVYPKATSVSAIGLALLFLSGLLFATAYASTMGMLWALIPAAILLFIAYKRWPQVPQQTI